MTARIFDSHGNVTECSDAEFFAAAFGHQPRTQAQIQIEWDARVERYIRLILSGCDLDEYGNPAVSEAKTLIALRDADSTVGDPVPPRRRAA